MFHLLWGPALDSSAGNFYYERKGENIGLANCDREQTHCFLIAEIQIQTARMCPFSLPLPGDG